VQELAQTPRSLSLAVGSIVFDPADATSNTLLVGTGELNFSGDSFAGVGVYETANAKSAKSPPADPSQSRTPRLHAIS
jgi:hypothetical protein